MLSLVESESYGSTLKAVLENGKEAEVIEGLTKLVAERQADIEEICSTFYGEFFQSVDELGSVKRSVEKVRDQLRELSSEARSMSAEFGAQAKRLHEGWAMAESSDRARATVGQALQAALDTDTLRQLVSTGQLCAALKLVERFRSVHVSALGHVAVVAHIAAQLPVFEAEVRTQASAQFKDWLSHAWAACSPAGTAGFRAAGRALADQRDLTRRTHDAAAAYREVVRSSLLAPDALASPSYRALHSATADKRKRDAISQQQQQQKQQQQQEADAKSDEQSLGLDFTHLYQAIYVYGKLGQLPEFKEEYAETKKLQVNKIFQATLDAAAAAAAAATAATTTATKPPPTAPGGNSETACQTMLRTLAGFFMIEHAVAHTTRGEFVSPGSLDELWRYALNKVRAVVLNELALCKTTTGFRAILESVVLFAEVMRRHRYDVGLVQDFLPESSQRYAEVAFEEFIAAIDASFRKNTWNPFIVSTREGLAELASNGLASPETRVPHQMRFSPSVPEFVSLVKSMITQFFVVAERLGDVERLVTKTADQCVQRFVRILSQRPPKSEFKMAAQLLADLHAITDIPAHLEAFIADRCTWGYTPKLEVARKLLEGAQSDTEGALQTMFHSKFDSILGPRIAMLVATASGAIAEPHAFVEEVKSFVSGVRETLEAVPISVSQSIISRSLHRVADTLVNALLTDQVKRVPYASLLALHSDCLQFEQFSSSLGYEPGSQIDPRNHFSRVLQVIRLLIKPDSTQLLELSSKPGAHPVLSDLSLMVSLLEKIREDKSSPAGYSKSVKATLKVLSQKV